MSNTGKYINYLDSEIPGPYYEDGTLDTTDRENYENSLYLKWLSATYGKTRMEKAGDWLMTKEGRHAALDGIGIFLDPADLVNAVIYLTEGEVGDAALSGISMIPILGDFFGKGGKGTKYLLKAADLTKLNRNKKVVKVLDSIDIFIKARKADVGELQKWIRKSLDNLANGGDEVMELVTPDGLRIRISGDLRANINLMDETGDMLQDTVRLGSKAGDGGTVLKAGSGTQAKIPGIELTREQRLIEFTDVKERSIAEFLENQGRTVIKNPLEGVAGAGRQGDSVMDGIKTEFKSLDPGATDKTIKNVVNKSIANEGQARQIVIDARGSGLSEELALKGTYRALGASNGKLDFIEVIGDGYFFRSVPKN